MATPVRALCEAEAATIASGASLSAGVNLSGRVLAGVYMPASWTSADLTFQASNDGSTWFNVYMDAAEVTVAATAATYVAIDPVAFLGVKHIKVRSGASGAAVNQAADRVLTLMLGQPSL